MLIGCRLAGGGATAPGGGATELMDRITLALLLLLFLTNDEGQEGQRVERERYSDRKSEKEGWKHIKNMKKHTKLLSLIWSTCNELKEITAALTG